MRQCERSTAIRLIAEHRGQHAGNIRCSVVGMHDTAGAGTLHGSAEQKMFKMFGQHQQRTATLQHAQRSADIAMAHAQPALRHYAPEIEQLRRKLQPRAGVTPGQRGSSPQHMRENPGATGGQRLQSPFGMAIIGMQVGKHPFAFASRHTGTAAPVDNDCSPR